MFYQNEHFIAKLDQSYKVWSPTTCGGSVPLAPMALWDKKALHVLLSESGFRVYSYGLLFLMFNMGYSQCLVEICFRVYSYRLHFVFEVLFYYSSLKFWVFSRWWWFLVLTVSTLLFCRGLRLDSINLNVSQNSNHIPNWILMCNQSLKKGILN